MMLPTPKPPPLVCVRNETFVAAVGAPLALTDVSRIVIATWDGLYAEALRAAGGQAVDGTPVYDVKPYLPWCEAQPDAKADWAGAAPFVCAAEAVLISDEFTAQLGGATTALVRQILRLDVQPAYQATDARTYGMTVAGWNVRWRAGAAGTREVCAVARVAP